MNMIELLSRVNQLNMCLLAALLATSAASSSHSAENVLASCAASSS